MAITTDNGKLAVMELDLDWEPGLPLTPGALGTDDEQQLLWGFPEFEWASPAAPGTGKIVNVAARDRSVIAVAARDRSVINVPARG